MPLRVSLLADRGVTVHVAPDAPQWGDLVGRADRVVPSPGISEDHPVFRAARQTMTPIRSELDLAGEWDDRPIAAVTGTNGKTTVTTMLCEALNRAGHSAVAAGNTDLPLVEAIADPAVEVFVVEASSFQLARTARFTPVVAVWLNFAPDHLDLHRSVDTYRAAKARIYEDLDATAVAVVNLDDPVVAAAETGPARRVTFGLDAGDWTVEDEHLVGPSGPDHAGERPGAAASPRPFQRPGRAGVRRCAGGADGAGRSRALHLRRVTPPGGVRGRG